ncbi:MAG: adenylate/guanylate cyclase domain-containing protein [Verrucomicrobiota bacterium]|nr:adenylate/guanylate cyclase domain-containing protein [Verrucomicrobiota bacterium]
MDTALLGLRQQLQELDNSADETVQAEERKLVTVLFVDISGFTALSEKLDPEEVRALINTCFESLVPIVQKYGGTVDKFIGDEIMALFGAPVAHEDDPERALRTALEMMEAIAAFNSVHGTTLNLHMGVNSGPVITGEVGSKRRRDYSVMGDAVNLAARLEGASTDGEIFVGPNTHRQTMDCLSSKDCRRSISRARKRRWRFIACCDGRSAQSRCEASKVYARLSWAAKET